jgi:hypothetical protein
MEAGGQLGRGGTGGIWEEEGRELGDRRDQKVRKSVPGPERVSSLDLLANTIPELPLNPLIRYLA